MKFDLTQKQAAELIREITMKYLDIDASLTTRNSRIVEEMLDDLVERRSKNAGWDEVLGILNDGSTPRESDEIEPLHPSLADSTAPFIGYGPREETDREIELRQRVAELEQAIAGAKGAEDVEQIVGHNRESPDVVALPVVDDNISDSPTPLSEPLKLEKRVPLDGTENDSNVETAMSVDDDRQWCNFVRIEQRDTAISAAIAKMQAQISAQADLQDEVSAAIEKIERRLNNLDTCLMSGTIATDLRMLGDSQRKMQEQIDSLAARCRLLENEDQNQHDSLVDHGHAIDQYREQIDALEKRIDFHAVNNPLNGNPDDISLHELISVVDQRCALIEQVLGGMTEEATFEKIDKLTEAVLMSLDHHKAVERGMKMWGSGDFERMANKLREGKEKGENNARL
jgi:archaellum component FlaC